LPTGSPARQRNWWEPDNDRTFGLCVWLVHQALKKGKQVILPAMHERTPHELTAEPLLRHEAYAPSAYAGVPAQLFHVEISVLFAMRAKRDSQEGTMFDLKLILLALKRFAIIKSKNAKGVDHGGDR